MTREDVENAAQRWDDYVAVRLGQQPDDARKLLDWAEGGSKAIAKTLSLHQDAFELDSEARVRFYEWTEDQRPLLMPASEAFDFGAIAGFCIGAMAAQFQAEREARQAGS